jgi:hypothetical protein
MLSEESLAGDLGIKTLYLIVRSLMGLVLLGKGENIVTLEQILALNEMVFCTFEEFRNYLYIKSLKYQKIRNTILSTDKQ